MGDPELLGQRPADRADHRPRVDQLREDLPGQVQVPAELVGPGPRPRVEQLGRRGVGPLPRPPAGQEPGEQVGHHQEGFGHLQDRRVGQSHRQQLIERVERQELEPGDLVDPLARDPAEGRLEHAVRPRIAVVDRVAQQRIPAPDQAEVDAPGVDPHAVEPRVGRGRFAEGDLDLFEEPGQVPVQGVEDPDRPVGEAVDLFEDDSLAVEFAQEPSPALSPQVEGQVVARFRHGAWDLPPFLMNRCVAWFACLGSRQGKIEAPPRPPIINKRHFRW